METASKNTARTITTSRRLAQSQTPKETSRINSEMNTGARMRSLNFVEASNNNIEATIEARYPNTYNPVANEMISLLCAAGWRRYFQALRRIQVSTASKIRAVSRMNTAGDLNSTLRHASTGTRNCEIVYSVVSKLFEVSGCQLNSRLLVLPAAS